jgi:hypothetical protein
VLPRGQGSDAVVDASLPFHIPTPSWMLAETAARL